MAVLWGYFEMMPYLMPLQKVATPAEAGIQRRFNHLIQNEYFRQRRDFDGISRAGPGFEPGPAASR